MVSYTTMEMLENTRGAPLEADLFLRRLYKKVFHPQELSVAQSRDKTSWRGSKVRVQHIVGQ